MNNYKMIVLDLDDTLLRDDLTISEKTKESILNAQKKGVKVVIATGRPTYACKSIAKEIGLNCFDGYIISFNGAVISQANNDGILRRISISKENVHCLYNLSMENGAFIQTYLGDNIITPKNNKFTEIEKKLTGMNIQEVSDFCGYINQDVIKVIILQEPEYLQSVAEVIVSDIPDKLNMTFSKPFFLEFMHGSVDKAASILFLAEKLNIDINEVIAVGDSYNDISMIKEAGLGVAMGNSVQKSKRLC